MAPAKEQKLFDDAWVVSVNMGYGHDRAAYPLKDFARGGIIIANNYKGIPKKDEKIWRESRKFYEFISRFRHVPIVGEYAFSLFDKWQSIPPFYPRRDLSAANFQTKQTYSLIRRKKWGEDLIKLLNRENGSRPLITTFFVVAFMAEYFNYGGDIYCQICDADISRNWAPLYPQKSRINYLAPNRRVVERLKLYGVKEEQIHLTGFPLPKENIGGPGLATLKEDIGYRIYNLDPQKRYVSQFRHTIKFHLGEDNFPQKSSHPLTVTFAVGGAGAQRELGAEILDSLKNDIKKERVKVNLVAGIRNEVFLYFKKAIASCGLEKCFGECVDIIFDVDKFKYFQKFNESLRSTDVLWTKPSELSFYTGLGLPIIMAPSVGSQEDFNRIWLKSVGGGITQNNPRYANEWLFDWIESGWLARAAMEGFTDAPKLGAYKVEETVLRKTDNLKEPPLAI
ncbi:MAG: hypothetical protein PHD51_00705 [Patescibacteria group bacterium]|nr:hypothetical protein [Patescibacteria group bacterium]MDD5490613.1 hypothetical protein [Patescibacteria group bacterium]